MRAAKEDPEHKLRVAALDLALIALTDAPRVSHLVVWAKLRERDEQLHPAAVWRVLMDSVDERRIARDATSGYFMRPSEN